MVGKEIPQPPTTQQAQQPTMDQTLMNSFQNQMNKNEMAEVIRELFDEKKIQLITDLTKDEIKLITRILIIAQMKNLKIWKDGIKWYLKLVLSKNRQSRKEILDAIRGSPMSGMGMLSKMNPMNWGGRRF